ncbi:MAG: hypothetical protein IJG64_01335 [Oscillospiraceae bacterium]|nr:hypothetical protein [Oscillospiraceae bacterium]
MRKEIFNLWHLVQRRRSLEDAATSRASPGFEMHYNASRCTEAPYEKYIIEACDMQEDIDKAVADVIQSFEDDNTDILSKTTGQRQRAMRLCFVCGKDDEYIADRLGIGIRTVEARLRGSPEKIPDGAFASFVTETRLLPIDAEVEEYLAKTYRNVQRMAGESYEEVEKLIAYHEARAADHRKQYAIRCGKIIEAKKNLVDEEKIIIEMWLGGSSWSEIGDAVGCNARNARKKFVKISNSDPFCS